MRKHFIGEAKPIPSINDEELGGLRNTDCDEIVVDKIRRVPTFQACKSSLYRSRAKTIPKLPSSQEEINIDGPWSRTLAGERFLLCDDTDPHGNRIIVFATDANLMKLCASERVFSDGTFYSCSTFFSQLYTLHAKVNGTVFPLYLDCCPTRPRTPHTCMCASLNSLRMQSMRDSLCLHQNTGCWTLKLPHIMQ